MLRVLHVDDEKEDHRIVRTHLVRLDKSLKIDWAKSGEKALSLLAATPYDCVLCDYQMEGLNGLQLLKELRDGGNDIPLIFLTCQGNEEIAAQALRSGADDYFIKQAGVAHYERLLNSVRRVVESFHRSRDHRRALDALRDSESRYRTLFESASDSIFIHGFSGNFLEVNTAACERLGYTKEELLRLCPADLDAPEFAPKIPDCIEVIRRHGHAFFETAHVRRDGSVIPIELSSRLIEYGGEPAILSIARDISERTRTQKELMRAHEELEKRVEERTRELKDSYRHLIEEMAEREMAERALEESRRKYKMLVEKLEEGMLLEDAEGKIAFVNPRTTEMLGYSEKELLGRHWTSIVPKEEIEKIEKELAKRPGGITSKYESTLWTKGGKSAPVIIGATPIFSDDGVYQGVLSVFTDITDRKQAEEALRESEAKYSAVVEQAMEGIAVLQDQVVKYCNKAAADISGYSVEALMGKPFIELIVEEERAQALELYEKRVAGNKTPILMEIKIQSKNGSVKWLESSGNYIEFDSRPADLVFLRDITLRKRAEEELEKARQELEQRVEDRTAELRVANKQLKKEIEDRKRAEETLRESEMLYRMVADLTSNYTFSIGINPDGTLQGEWIEGEYERIHGCEWDINNDPDNWVRMVHPDDVPIASELLQQCLSNKPVTTELRIIRADGAVRWVRHYGFPKWDEKEGRVVRFIGTTQDITAKKLAEEQVKKQLTALEAAMDGMAILDEDGVYVYLNDAHVQIYGYDSSNELLGRTWRILYTDDWVRHFEKEIMPDLYKEGEWRGEAVGKKKDGTLFAQELSLSVTEAGGIVCVVRDITDRKKAEEALKESNEWLRTVFEGSRDAIFIVDGEARFVSVNDAALLLTGYSMKELSKMSIPELHDEEDLHAYKTFFHQIMAGDSILTEAKLRKKDGEKIDVEFSNKKITVGERSYMHTVARDMTERKKAAEELKRHSERLEERTRQLTAINKELEAFSYSVSHDLRAPLWRLDGFSEILKEKYTCLLDEEGKEYLDRIRIASKQMRELIDDLLKLSQVTRVDLRRQSVDLTALAQEVINDLRNEHPLRGVEFVNIDSQLVEGDERLLRLVMENLVGNAWKFTKQSEKARIEFGVFLENEKRVFYIRDNGAGFDNSKVDKLFAPFRRLHKESEFGGTGIGLATVKRIIHRHGGSVWAEGKIGEGATFYFTLT